VVKKALEGLEGVKEATVSFKEKRADVLYDPSKVTVEDMISAISRVGFRAKRKGDGDA
jgi:copper chaperone CopZ